jgi:DNA (cytosine-5)-methyltransferase 1
MPPSADYVGRYRPRLLDLFCGAGGATKGYQRAGFYVVGVDINPQPNYCGDEFHRGDAMTWPLDGFAAIHASPPCHDHSPISACADNTGWMLDGTIARLRGLEVPWVVENVVGPTVKMDGWWFVLCGSSFGLKVRRHRRFGSNRLMLAPSCRHHEQGTPLGVYGSGGGGHYPSPNRGGGVKADRRDFAALMDMPWATPAEIVQAIPPAYTEWIGGQLV